MDCFAFGNRREEETRKGRVPFGYEKPKEREMRMAVIAESQTRHCVLMGNTDNIRWFRITAMIRNVVLTSDKGV